MTKKCSKCKELKDELAYGVCKLVKSRLYPSCNQCRRDLSKETTRLKRLKREEELKNNPPPPKTSKRCSKCKEIKKYELFVSHKLTKDGKAPSCKSCMKKARDQDKDHIKSHNKKYYESVKATGHYKKVYRDYYMKNSSKIKKRVALYKANNKSQVSKLNNRRKSERYYSDYSFNLLCKIRAMIIRTIKGRKCKSVYYVGVNTPEEFLNIMNSKCNNPNWISDKYQIDHIWQVHWFTEALEKDPENVSKLIHNHENLRPIPASENINRNKYDYSCLKFEEFDTYKPYINEDILVEILEHFNL